MHELLASRQPRQTGGRKPTRAYRRLLTVVSTQEQLAGPVGAMFLHLPGFLLAAVQATPAWQIAPPILLAQGPAATTPAFCSRPGKPVSLEQVPAYVTAVETVTMAPAATISTSDDEKATINLFGSLRVNILCSICAPEGERQGFLAFPQIDSTFVNQLTPNKRYTISFNRLRAKNTVQKITQERRFRLISNRLPWHLDRD